MTKHLLLLATTILSLTQSFSQDKPNIQFEHVALEDFSLSKLQVDTSYGAVIIADVGKSSFQGNSKSWFSLVYKHQRRVRIISKKGLELASVNIPLFVSSNNISEERVEDLKASTYNIENGVVVETKLGKESIFKEKLTNNYFVTKFTMPAVKEGSIIEYSYTIKSDFLFNLQPWIFQGEYPRVWSEYELDMPSFFEYIFMAKGYIPYDIKTEKTHSESYNVRDNGQIFRVNSDNVVTRWVIKNVPVFKEESFVSSLRNHLSAIEFQMSAQQFPNMPRRNVMGSWAGASEILLKDEGFGAELSTNNPWLNSDLVQGQPTQLDQAKKIFSFVKNNYKSLGAGSIYLSKPLKETYKTKGGYVSDINLLLVAMMNHQNLQATPVVLSTRSHGYSNPYYPLINRFNYVVCRVVIDDKPYYLDASQPHNGFNRLPSTCFNGHARLIDRYCSPTFFSADSITEQKSTTTMLFNDPAKPGKWTGFVNTDFGYFESLAIRQSWLEHGNDSYTKKLKEAYTGEYTIDEIKYEEENNDDVPMKLSHSLVVDAAESADIIYFNPMIKEGVKENYFKSADRKYPVEIPYRIDETYTFKIEVPEGYTVDEMPKSTKVSLNDEEGFFEYVIALSGNYIDLTTRVKLNKANFLPEDYETLRDFFGIVVKKHAEQIVFKKK